MAIRNYQEKKMTMIIQYWINSTTGHLAIAIISGVALGFGNSSSFSMSRVWGEYGKSVLRVCLQYVFSMAEEILNSSFSVPLVFLLSPDEDSMVARYINRGLTKVYTSGNIYSSANEVGFVAS